jgi:hypothetical protein
MEMTRGEMQDLLAKFSVENPEYRQALLKDPKSIVTKQFAISVPANVKVKVIEETADTLYVVLPHSVEQGEELSDADLEAVAGGHTFVKDAKCEDGVLNTVISIEAGL